MRAASRAIRHAFHTLSHTHSLTQARPRAVANIALSLNVYAPSRAPSPHVALRQCLGHFEAPYEARWREGGVRASSSVPSPAGIGVQAGQEGAQEVRVVWVKRATAPRWVKVVSVARDVDGLIQEIVKELGIKTRLNTLTLHVERAGGSLGPALDSRARLEAAGVVEGTNIVVKGTDTVEPMSALIEWPADDDLAKLAAALEYAAYDPATKSITLPEDVMWPGLYSNVLYVRSFYKDLWESVLKHGRAGTDGVDGGIILGTPGIGKSAFGLYALYRAIRDGRTVVYDSRKGGFAIFKAGKAYTTATAGIALNVAALAELRDPHALYISNSIPPAPFKGAFTLVITSPKKENWSEFFKSAGVVQCVVPVLTEEEIMELHKLAFDGMAGCSEAEVKARFHKWGGNARNVLTKGADIAWQSQLELEAVPPSLPLATLQQTLVDMTSMRGTVGDDDVRRLVDLVPRGALRNSTTSPCDYAYYTLHHAELPSMYVVGKIVHSLQARDQAEFYRFVRAAGSDPTTAAFRSVLYQRAIVVPQLQRGAGMLRLERLSGDRTLFPQSPLLKAQTHLNLADGIPVVHFNDAEDLKRAWMTHVGNAVFLPRSKQQVAFDFVLRVDGMPLLANASVGENHDIKVGNDLFQKVLEAVGLPLDAAMSSEIPFLWIVPEEAFARLNKPGALRGPSGTANAPAGRRVAQYKVLLEIPKPGGTGRK